MSAILWELSPAPGIHARSYAASMGPLSILTEGTVTGGTFGIDARNYGTGALEIVAHGDVVGTAANSTAILARNYGNDLLQATTGAGTTSPAAITASLSPTLAPAR